MGEALAVHGLEAGGRSRGVRLRERSASVGKPSGASPARFGAQAARPSSQAPSSQAPSSQAWSSMVGLADRVRRANSPGLRATWAVDLAGCGTYTFRADSKDCRISAGASGRPEAAISTDLVTWDGIRSGLQAPLAALSCGALRARGDLNLALHLLTLLRDTPEPRLLRTTRTRTEGVEVEALVAGGGTPVLLLHGIAASKVSMVSLVDGLADHYEVHALDLPGFGRSSKPLPTGRRYSLAWMADVVAGYLHENGLSRAHVVGNSMGGRIGLEFALRYPDRALGLVGLGSAVPLDVLRWLAPTLRLLQSQWFGIAPVPLPRDRVVAASRELMGDPDCVTSEYLEGAVEDFLRHARDPRNRMAIAACLRHLGIDRGVGRQSVWRRLAELRGPSYWIWGDRDPLISHRYGERIRACAPSARVEIWEGVGHLPQIEDPRRTTAKVREFLQAVECAPAPVTAGP